MDKIRRKPLFQVSGISFLWGLATISFISACSSQRADSNSNIVLAGTITLSPERAPADGQTTIQVIVDLKNALNVSSEGLDVRLEADAPAVHIEQPAKTDKNGVATGTLTSSSVLTTNIRAYVQLSGGEQRLVANAVVEFYSLEKNVSLTASPTTVLANGNNFITVVATLTDAEAGALAGKTVTFSSSAAQDIWGANDIVTGVDGKATTTLVSTLAGTRNIQASIDGFSGTTSVTFVAGDLDISNCSVSVDPNSLDATSGMSANVEVSANDSYGNPIEGISVILSSSDATDSIISANANTNALGVAMFSVSGSTEGLHTLTADLNGETITATLNIVPGNPNASYSSLTANPNTETADNASTIVATFTLMSDYNRPMIGKTVTCSASGTSTNITTPAPTDANGTTSCAYSTAVAQDENIIVSYGSMSLEVPISFAMGGIVSFLENQDQDVLVLSEYLGVQEISNAYNRTLNTDMLVALTNQKTVTPAIHRNSERFHRAMNPQAITTMDSDHLKNARDTGTFNGIFGDMTGDGIPDLITVSERHNRIEVASIRNLYEPKKLSQVSVKSPKFVDVADINNDGFLDAVTVSHDAQTVTILLGAGDGTLTVSDIYNLDASSSATGLALTDLDNNGSIDIVVAMKRTGILNLLFNAGDGTYASGNTVYVGGNTSNIDFDDIEINGTDDGFVLSQNGKSLTVFEGYGNRESLSRLVDDVCDVSIYPNVVYADMNGDGKSDLVVSCIGKQ